MSGAAILNTILVLAAAGLMVLRGKMNTRIHDALQRSRTEGMTIEQYVRYCIDVVIGTICFILVLALRAQGYF
jgi:hypothetical protein